MRQREFRLLLAAHATSLFGDAMAPVALAFAVLELTGEPAAVGLVFATRMVAMLGLLLAGGVVADRRSRRSVMVVADLTRAASQGLTAALLVAGAAELWQIALLQAVHGGASAAFLPASGALTPAIVPVEELQQANALRGVARSAGMLGGPAAAAVLVTAVGAGWAVAVDAATFVVSAAFLARMRCAGGSPAPGGRPFRVDLHDGWREFRARTWVWAGVTAASAANMLFAAYLVLGPAIADADLGGAAAWGLISSALGAGMLLGGLCGLRMRLTHPLRAVALLLSLPAAPALALATGAATYVAAAWAVVAGLGLALVNAIWETTLQREVPERVLARVTAYDWLGSFALQPFGYVVAGVLGSALGLRQALLLVAILFVGTAGGLMSVCDVRRLRVTEAPSRA